MAHADGCGMLCEVPGLAAPGLNECISGVILFEETMRQAACTGRPFVQVAANAGILVGIKADTGAKDLAGHPGEKVTEGLDGLRDRLQSYFASHRASGRARHRVFVGRAVR
jgi:fructose-bisphosphate aldolase, class I